MKAILSLLLVAAAMLAVPSVSEATNGVRTVRLRDGRLAQVDRHGRVFSVQRQRFNSFSRFDDRRFNDVGGGRSSVIINESRGPFGIFGRRQLVIQN